MKNKSTSFKRKSLVKLADMIFSIYIREKTRKEYGRKCPFCLVKPIDCCFHFFSRVAYATRWDEDNAIGSCVGCNMRMEYDPYPFYKFFKDKFGQEKLDALSFKYHSVTKLDNSDLQKIVNFYKSKLEGK